MVMAYKWEYRKGDHKKDDGKGVIGLKSWVESKRSDITVVIILSG